MPWGYAAAAALSIGGSMKQGSDAKSAAGDAADASREQWEAGMARMEEGISRAREGLQPYADQEAIARNTYMTQLGLLRPAGYGGYGGGGQPMMGGGGGYGGSGVGMVPIGGPGLDTQYTAQDQRTLDNFIDSLLQRNITAAYGSGYHRTDGVIQGARRTHRMLEQLQDEGMIPLTMDLPSEDTVLSMGSAMVKDNNGHEGLIRKQIEEDGSLYTFDGRNTQNYGYLPGFGDEQLMQMATDAGLGENFGTTSARDQLTGQDMQGEIVGMNPDGTPIYGVANNPSDMRYYDGGGGQMMGGGQPMGPMSYGGAGIENMAAPGVMGGSELMGFYGATRAPDGFATRYYTDVETPGYAEGWDYMMNPAYQQMIEENARTINQHAANAGSLYSGRRGRALSDMSANTQYDFMKNLQGVRSQDLARRGELMGENIAREDQYLANYQNLLQAMAQPTSAANIANIEVGQTGAMAYQGAQAVAQQNEANLAGTAASNAALADGLGAVTSMLGDQPWKD